MGGFSYSLTKRISGGIIKQNIHSVRILGGDFYVYVTAYRTKRNGRGTHKST